MPVRNIQTGNPYRRLVADLIARGVRVELCGAMARTIELVQDGFVKISE